MDNTLLFALVRRTEATEEAFGKFKKAMGLLMQGVKHAPYDQKLLLGGDQIY